MIITSPVFIKAEFNALPSDALQGIITIPDLLAGDILISICPKYGTNPGADEYFDNIIATDTELVQSGGYWEGSTPVMVAVFIRG